jgi:PAS domain S-box-containing protein
MKKTIPFIFLVILLTAGAYLALAQGDDTAMPGVVTLTDEAGQYPLAGHISVLKDATGQLTIEQVAAPETAGRFAPSDTPTPQFGITREAIWLKFSLDDQSHSTSEWVLDIPNPSLEQIDIFIPQPNGGYEQQRAGLIVPYSASGFPESYYTFQLPAGLRPDQPIYLRITTGGTFVVPLTIWTHDAFVLHKQGETLLWGIYFGILFSMAIYNFFLFFSLRDRNYFYLVLFIVAVSLQTAFLGGQLKALLPDSLGEQYLYFIPLLATTNLLFLLLFTASFLEIKRLAPRLNQLIIGLMLLIVLTILLAFVIDRYLSSVLFLLTALLSIGILVFSGLIAWRRGYRPARYFLLAIFFPFVISLGDPLGRLGVLTYSNLFYFAGQFGNAALVILLSLALADRINYFRQQTEETTVKLRQSEALINQYLDALPVGVAVYGNDTKPRFVNRSAMSLFQISQYDREVTLDSASESFPLYLSQTDTPYPAEKRPISQALKGYASQLDDAELEVNGRRIPAEFVTTPIYDDLGRVQYAIAVFRDISQRKEQETAVRLAQELYQSVVEKETLLICRFNQTGNLTFINEAYRNYFADSQEMSFSNLFTIFHEAERHAVLSELANISPENPVQVIERQTLPLNGEIRWLRWTCQGFFGENGRFIEYQATGADITEQKQAEAQLARYREDLENLVTERTHQERRQRAIAESLQLSASVLSRELNLNTVLTRILEQLPIVLPLDNAAIYIKEGAYLILSNATNYSQYNLGLKVPLFSDRFSTAEVFQKKTTIAYPDAENDPEWRHWENKHRIRSWMGTPLQSGNQVIGVLSVSSEQPNVYDRESQTVLEAFANHAAIAMINARLYEDARLAAILEERNRLARDLHDSVTQTLFSATIIAEALPLQWEQDQAGGRSNLARLRQLTSGALAEMRLLLLELRPASLTHTPLNTMIKHLCEAFRAKHSILVVENLAAGNDASLPSEVKEAFYRITQEAFNNIAKHARANRLEVHLEQITTGIRLCIQDNGKGFDTASGRTDDRLGLSIMRERAAEVNASLQIESLPGTGTTVICEWRKLQ